MAELIDAVEKGHDHDSDPLQVTARYTGVELDMGFYSRLREINETRASPSMASAAGPRIVVTRRIPDPALELLHEAGGEVWVSPHDRPMTTEELYDAIAGADAIVTLLHDRVDEACLDAAGKQLAVISNVAVGYDNVDVAAVVDRGIIFTNTPGVLTEATADIAFALMLMSTRRLEASACAVPAEPGRGTCSYARHRPAGEDARDRRDGPDRGRPPPGGRARFWHGDRLHGAAAGRRRRWTRSWARGTSSLARRPAGHVPTWSCSLPAPQTRPGT